MDNGRHTKKAAPAKHCSASIQTQGICTKKRDCTVAVPLHWLWYCHRIRTSNTEAHADMYAHAHLLLYRCTEIDIHIPRTSKCCNVLESMKFTRFRIAKHKARWIPLKTSFIGDTILTPLLCLLPKPMIVNY